MSRLNTDLRFSANAAMPSCQSGLSILFLDARFSSSIDSWRIFESKQAHIGVKSGLNKRLVLFSLICLTLHVQMVSTSLESEPSPHPFEIFLPCSSLRNEKN